PRLFACSHPSTTAISTLSLHDALPILDLSTWSSNTVTSDPSGARTQPQNVALAWRPGITFKPAESRNYTFGLDGDVLTLVDRERSEEHTSELQSRENLVCRLLLEKKNR